MTGRQIVRLINDVFLAEQSRVSNAVRRHRNVVEGKHWQSGFNLLLTSALLTIFDSERSEKMPPVVVIKWAILDVFCSLFLFIQSRGTHYV